MQLPAIDVAVSILKRADGRVLMAERTATQLSPGYWELPGGKVDPGETPEQAARRELTEEIGVEALAVRPWIRYEHDYRTRRIRLFFFRVERWEGTPRGVEGQRLDWIDPAAPHVAPLLPSVDRVLTALGLPTLYAVIRTAEGSAGEASLVQIDRALRAGLRLIHLREPRLTADQRVALARRAGVLAQPYRAHVMLGGTALDVRRAGLDGLHSTAAEARLMHGRPPVKLWIASCHDAVDLDRAVALGADAAVLSPVLPTPSHPERAALGWAGLKSLVAGAAIPVFAQGGLGRADLPRALEAGAAGVATAGWEPVGTRTGQLGV